MASPLDMNEFTAKERDAARKDLLKKIEVYNKRMRMSKEPSFPLSTPGADLVYRGIVKVKYDRGYAVQLKSMLVGSDSVAEDLIGHLIRSLGLTGCVDDYVLEERNLLTQSTRTIKKTECPLNIQLQYGAHSSILEFYLVQIHDSRKVGRSHEIQANVDINDDYLKINSLRSVPKDEVVDHGAAKLETIIHESLQRQDVPALVSEVQEKLKLLSETVACEGKPHSKLPSRRALWDMLKPKVGALVKDIRQLLEDEELLTIRFCPSEEFRLVVTLLLELITDYSRELITVTKELCGLKGAVRADFDTSVSNFVQQITYISKLVGRSCDCLHAAALSGHLLHVTAPEIFLQGKSLDESSYFTGSATISGVLIFTTISAYLGLIRATYEDKADYYAALANNMLQSTQRILQKVQQSSEYAVIHHHPLRSRITDMEHKLKVAMDALVRSVKVAAAKHPPPVSVPEMLLAGHNLILATLDFLIVAQCASLLHDVSMAGRELLQLPWVRGWVTSKANKADLDGSSESSSTFSDSTLDASIKTLSSTSSGRRPSRKSRIASHKGTSPESSVSLSIEQLTIQPSHLPLNYSGDSGNDADDEAGRSVESDDKGKKLEGKDSPPSVSMATSDAISPVKPLSLHLFSSDSSQYMGIDAVKRLRKHQVINKAVSKAAESLSLTITQKVHFLSQQCYENSQENYAATVNEILRAAEHLQDEVSVMECDLLGSNSSIEDTLATSHEQMESATRGLYMSLASASVTTACDKDRIRLMAAAATVSDLCSQIIRDVLNMVTEHKKALAQAEKLEEEFVALMTGYKLNRRTPNSSIPSDSSPTVPTRSRKALSGVKLPSDHEADSVMFEEVSTKAFTPGSAWLATKVPKIIGGSLKQLLQRVTYHRVVDSEFVETFILTFHNFMSCGHLLQTLIEKYNTKPQSTEIDKESFENDITIPIRLRVVHALRLWLQYHCQDFSCNIILEGHLKTLLQQMEGEMSACSHQLQNLLKGHKSRHRQRTSKQSSQPIIPLVEGDKFHITDCNTLELARQLCLTYFKLFSTIKLKELSTFALNDGRSEWKEEISDLQATKVFSRNLSKVISNTLLQEDDEEKQSLIITYFIKTAESCHQLKNYEAVAVIIAGLTSESVKSASIGAWQMLSDSHLQTLKTLQRLVSKDMSFNQYQSEFKTIHSSPCIPLLDAVLSDISSIHRDIPNTLPNSKDTLNFAKWRQLANVLLKFYAIQDRPYGFMVVETIQEYLQELKQPQL